MVNRRYVGASILILLSLSFVVGNVKIVAGWSNGGFSDDPAKPDYGTHDWIAEHALYWLPPEERQFIVDNNSTYLYGTELPDNWQAADGIGDTFKHHVYYYGNYSLQDNASAVRAQEEYNDAVAYFKAGNLTAAAKSLGAMTHYISDLAVFAHVTGAETEWGSDNQTLHSRYEDYVNTRTNSYDDEFNVFLVFDGALTSISAYDAASALAYNTTFGANGDYTCVWINQNYNWSNPAFRNRCGESLNLAVNLIADVLHTFYLEAVIPEFPPSLILPIFMIVSLLTVVCVKKKLKKNRLFH